jgi:pimeloyl-ACP methyl ester carboxylesterase
LETLLAYGREQWPDWDEVEFGPWAEAKLQMNPRAAFWIRDAPTRWSEIVPQITCPTLLVTGDPEMGSIVTPPIAKRVVAMNPRIKVVQISGAGHNIRRERFGQFISTVSAFLAE